MLRIRHVRLKIGVTAKVRFRVVELGLGLGKLDSQHTPASVCTRAGIDEENSEDSFNVRVMVRVRVRVRV